MHQALRLQESSSSHHSIQVNSPALEHQGSCISLRNPLYLARAAAPKKSMQKKGTPQASYHLASGKANTPRKIKPWCCPPTRHHRQPHASNAGPEGFLSPQESVSMALEIGQGTSCVRDRRLVPNWYGCIPAWTTLSDSKLQVSAPS